MDDARLRKWVDLCKRSGIQNAWRKFVMSTEIRKHIGREISLLHRYTNLYIEAQLEAYDLKPGQYLFLSELFHMDDITQDELANTLKFDKGTTARALSILEAAGYITREVDPTNRRCNRIRLTKKAQAFKERFMDVINGYEEVLTQGLSSQEKEITLDLVKRIAANASNHWTALLNR
jgi:DNA-binding MarR family transcriptional regulator